MRASGLVVGVLVCILGLVWIGQGLGYIKGSFMTGSPLWAVLGAVALVLGVVALVVLLRRSPRGAPPRAR